MGVDYQAYLASREWSLKREAVRERSGNRCERCWRAPQQAVHHMTYAHVGDEPLDELLAVCNPCHAWLSGKGDVDPAADRLGFVQLIPGSQYETLISPSAQPRFGLQRFAERGRERCPDSTFAFSENLHALVSDAWFIGYHVAASTCDNFVTGWFVTPELAEIGGAYDGVAAGLDEAWRLFIARLTRARRPSWMFVPDDQFPIYADGGAAVGGVE